MAKKAMGAVLSATMWAGRATTFMVGLAVILALTVGVAGAAFAANGGNFILGQNNAASAITRLASSAGVAGPSLQIDNNSTNASATALVLQVEPGKAPMKVNSATRVDNLNSDKLDGMDASQFLYTTDVRSAEQSSPGNSNGTATANCGPGEQATGGGVALASGDASKIVFHTPGGEPVGDPATAWRGRWYAQEVAATVRVFVVCVS